MNRKPLKEHVSLYHEHDIETQKYHEWADEGYKRQQIDRNDWCPACRNLGQSTWNGVMSPCRCGRGWSDPTFDWTQTGMYKGESYYIGEGKIGKGVAIYDTEERDYRIFENIETFKKYVDREAK